MADNETEVEAEVKRAMVVLRPHLDRLWSERHAMYVLRMTDHDMVIEVPRWWPEVFDEEGGTLLGLPIVRADRNEPGVVARG